MCPYSAGKTQMDELAWALRGENVHYGTPANPAAPGCIPGGSSSGSAVAVAAGYADVGLGTDTAGSVRVPAAYTGIFGFRPTHGRISLIGCVCLAPSFDTVGWFARDAATLAAAGGVLLDRAKGGGDATAVAVGFSRAMVARDAFAMCEPETEAALRGAIATIITCSTRLGDAGAGTDAGGCERIAALMRLDGSVSTGDAVDSCGGGDGGGGCGVTLPEVDLGGWEEGLGADNNAAASADVPPLSEWWTLFRTLQTHEAWRAHETWVTAYRPAFGPGVKERFAGAAGVMNGEVGRRVRRR